MVDPKRQCVVFLTHIWSPAIRRHYERLKREASPLVDVYLAYHAGKPVPEGVKPDIVLTNDVMGRYQPRRYATFKNSERVDFYQYVDLVFLAAFQDPVLARYDYFWLVENDVDYTGNWADFFSEALTYEGDLLAQTVSTRSEIPDFDHWYWYAQPDDVTVEPMRVLICMSRYSRRMVDAIRTEGEREGWEGMFENVHPTIAMHLGLELAQLGGSGSFVPPERVNRHYKRSERTFTFRPARGYRYFVDAPQRFRYRNRLYHPIKVDWSMSQRVKDVWSSALRRWDEHSPFVHWLLPRLGLNPRPMPGMPPKPTAGSQP